MQRVDRPHLAADFPYGQALGWLRLTHDGPGPVIKGYGYLLPQQQFKQRFRQTLFRDTCKEIEVGFEYSGASNAEIGEIGEKLRAEIVGTTAQGRVFERRWLDMAAFEKVAPFID